MDMFHEGRGAIANIEAEKASLESNLVKVVINTNPPSHLPLHVGTRLRFVMLGLVMLVEPIRSHS